MCAANCTILPIWLRLFSVIDVFSPSDSDFDEQNDGELFYRLRAYGRDFHFNLTRNDHLTSPSLIVEYWSRDPKVRRLAEVTSRRCHYVGHIASEDTTSSVAFSNCFGLVG